MYGVLHGRVHLCADCVMRRCDLITELWMLREEAVVTRNRANNIRQIVAAVHCQTAINELTEAIGHLAEKEIAEFGKTKPAPLP